MPHRLRDPESFDHLAQVYDRFSALTSGSVANYLDGALPSTGRRAVDLGCGTGVHTELLADRYSEVLGVDVSAPMLAVATAARQRPTITYVQRDLLTMDGAVDGTFDAVFSAFVLHHVHPLEEGLRRVTELVQPGGHAVLIDMVDDQPRSRRWFQRQALRLGATDIWRRRRPMGQAVELLRLRLDPGWLDHLTADHPLNGDEFRSRYNTMLPGAVFTDLDRAIAVCWRRPSG